MNFKKAAVVANLALIVGLITPLTPVAYASSASVTKASSTAKPGASTASQAVISFPGSAIPTSHLNVTIEDLKYILDQIKIGEAHAARTTGSAAISATYGSSGALTFPYDVLTKDRCLLPADIAAAATITYGPTGLSNNYTYANTAPWGIRQVDGQCNNITSVQAETMPFPAGTDLNNPVVPQPSTAIPSDTGSWGAADQLFSRLTPAKTIGAPDLNSTQNSYKDGTLSVTDPAPRIISNLISDQSSANPAATAAGTRAAATLGLGGLQTETAVNSQTGTPTTVSLIPNVTPDFNQSAGYNSWFTLFGQFFDHGLDLIPKGGAQVFIPLQQGDPLYAVGAPNMMVLTRGATDAAGDASNITTPYVDQSQAYGSHASQNFFLREYSFSTGVPISTGKLLSGTDSVFTSAFIPTPPVASTVTAALANGSSITFTAANTFAVGTKVNIRGVVSTGNTLGTAGRGFNLTSGIILTRSNSQFTIASSLIDTYTSGGAASNASKSVAVLDYLTRGYSPATPLSPVSNGGLPTWRDIKAQSHALGINLTDWDVDSIPVIATDQYGKFIPAPSGAGAATGFPMMLFSNHLGGYMWLAGTPASPIATTITLSAVTWYAVSSGHPFLNDTMAAAVPFDSAGGILLPDADSIMNGGAAYSPSHSYYDDETLNSHFIAGDGRVNENIGLSSLHYTFHAEHNTLVDDIQGVVGQSPSSLFRAEWTPERLYQAARMINESEYQHMVFDEFNRRLSPNLKPFGGYNPSVNPSISQEFASSVYRLGHSMLNETLARSNADSTYDPANNQDVSLLTGFTNPAQSRLVRPAVIASAAKGVSNIVYTLPGSEVAPLAGSVVTITGMADAEFNFVSAFVDSSDAHTFTITEQYVDGSGTRTHIAMPTAGSSNASVYPPLPLVPVSIARVTINDPGINGYNFTPAQSAAAIAQGMSAQRGNEIDEFVTDAVRNNLLGLPLDLASLNLTRGRDTMLPTLNQYRKANAATLAPYVSWADFISKLRNRESGVNFIAAYGTHPDITSNINIGDVTSVTADGTDTIYTLNASAGLTQGDVVTISGFAAGADAKFNLTNAVVASVAVGGLQFTVRYKLPHGVQDTYTGANTPQAVAISGTATSVVAKLSRAKNVTEKRAAAQNIVDNISNTPNYSEFYYSTGAYSSGNSGFNDIDLWVGGLAESPQVSPGLPPMLGPVFDSIFLDQMAKLQNSDRFYYLNRIVGLNFGQEIPAQKFTDIVRRNTFSGTNAFSSTKAMGNLGFGIFDCSYGTINNVTTSGTSFFPNQVAGCGALSHDTPGTLSLEHVDMHNAILAADQDPLSTPGASLLGGGGDDHILGGHLADVLQGGYGADVIEGAAGNDILAGSGGDDILNGNEGDDVINASGSVPGGGIFADGGSGNDFISKGDNGATASMIGETGDDFIEGGTADDFIIEGGEGADWLEGGDGNDGLTGDTGLNPGGGVSLYGGNDVLWGQNGADILDGNGGDDIFILGDVNPDAVVGGTGFNWANYFYQQRHETGTANPSAYVDLSGIYPNQVGPGFDAGEALAGAGVDGIGGSAGDDIFYTTQGSNQSVAGASGILADSKVTLPGIITTILPGMMVSGSGIAPNAVVAAAPTLANINGLTVSILDISVPNTGTVTGTLKFTMWPLRDTAVVNGIQTLLSTTSGWNKAITASGTFLTALQAPTDVTPRAGSFITLTVNDASIQTLSTISFTHTGGTFSGTISNISGGILEITPAVGSVSPTSGQTFTNIQITPVSQWTGGNIILAGDGSDTIHVVGGSNVIDGKSFLNTCIAYSGSLPVGLTTDKTYGAGTGCFSSMSLIAAYMNAGTMSPTLLSVVREIVTPIAPVGSDVVVFPLASSAYAITAAGSGWDVTGPDGNVTRLVNVDLVGFGGTAVGALAPAAQDAFPTFTASTPPATAQVNMAYSYQFAAANATSWSVLTGTLPTGMTLGASSGILGGTPTATGLYTFTVRATGAGKTTSVSVTILVYSLSSGSGGGGAGGGVPAGVTVSQLVPTIVWANPAAITTDQALSSTQLNAIAKNPITGDIVAGKFVYYPAAGEKLQASDSPTSPRTLVVQFTPTDSTLFSNAVGTAKIIVTQATKSASIVVSNTSLQVTYNGLPHEAQVTSNVAMNKLSISYNGFSTVPINAGTYAVEVKSNDPSYVGTVSATLVIAKATPTVTWNPPATWNSADPVTDALLNASSSTVGTFTYSAALGSNFAAGTRAIKVVFDPKDSTNYNSVTVEKSLTVSASSATTTKALALVLKGKFTATTTLSAKDKAALKKAAPSKAVVVTVSAYVSKGASKSADLTASRAKAAKVVSLLKKSAPKATYVIQAMGSTLNAACTAQKNECVLINIG